MGVFCATAFACSSSPLALLIRLLPELGCQRIKCGFTFESAFHWIQNEIVIAFLTGLTIPTSLKVTDNFLGDLSHIQINWLWKEGVCVEFCPTSEKSGLRSGLEYKI